MPRTTRTVRKKLTDSPADRAYNYLTIGSAAKSVGVTEDGIRWHIRNLGIELVKFPLDPKSYIKKEDVQRIQTLRGLART